VLSRNSVAIVTGSGSGIGRACAIALAKEGARTVVVDVDEKGGDETLSLIHDMNKEAMFVRADATKANEVKSAVDETAKKYGPVTILVNNVGGWQAEMNDTVTESPEDEWDRLIQLNLKPVFLFSKHCIPLMASARGGAIINIATTNAQLTYPKFEAYSASKAAVVELTRAMAMDYGHLNIRVNALLPGEVITPQWKRTMDRHPEEKTKNLLRLIPLGRFAQPEDIAAAALFLASEEAAYVTGASILVDGGLSAGFYDIQYE
jgi:NAD(P)-dependent dehydrogenase (short-subunit alcohol dehydrogenase family)